MFRRFLFVGCFGGGMTRVFHHCRKVGPLGWGRRQFERSASFKFRLCRSLCFPLNYRVGISIGSQCRATGG